MNSQYTLKISRDELLKVDGNAKLSEGWSLVKIFNYGKQYHSKYGWIDVTEKMVDQMVQNFSNEKKRFETNCNGQEYRIAFDYNHDSMGGDPVSAKAAGWIYELVKKNDGLYVVCNWTEMALSMIRSNEYAFVSPEFHPDDYIDKTTGKKVGARLHAVAITNRPFYNTELPALAASDADLINKKTQTKDEEKIRMKNISNVLSLKDDASEADVVVKINDVIRESVALKDENKNLKEEALQLREFKENSVKAMAELQNQNKSLSDEIDNIKAKEKSTRIETKIKDAIREGKIVKVQESYFRELALKDESMFDKYIELTQSKMHHNSSVGVSDQGNGDINSELDRVLTDSTSTYDQIRKAQIKSGKFIKK